MGTYKEKVPSNKLVSQYAILHGAAPVMLFVKADHAPMKQKWICMEQLCNRRYGNTVPNLVFKHENRPDKHYSHSKELEIILA